MPTSVTSDEGCERVPLESNFNNHHTTTNNCELNC